MRQYLDLLQDILTNGVTKTDRTGTGTISVFGRQMRFDLSKGFPLVTTKKLHLKSIIHELLWFLKGDTNVKYLQENGVRIWNEWADENGELGHIYGYQWRSWPDYNGGHIDQIAEVVRQIKETPDSRRMIVSAWNVADIPLMNLPAVSCTFSSSMWQTANCRCSSISAAPTHSSACRSTLLPTPCVLQMMAQVTGLQPGEFVHTLGDTHLYLNHLDQARLQLQREPRPLPTMHINPDVKSNFRLPL